MRGQLSAVYLSTINLLGLGFGPSLVAGASERLGGPNAIGHALALSAGTLAPLGALLLLVGLAPLRRAVAKAEAWPNLATSASL
jgi:hypothetical protein